MSEAQFYLIHRNTSRFPIPNFLQTILSIFRWNYTTYINIVKICMLLSIRIIFFQFYLSGTIISKRFFLEFLEDSLASWNIQHSTVGSFEKYSFGWRYYFCYQIISYHSTFRLLFIVRGFFRGSKCNCVYLASNFVFLLVCRILWILRVMTWIFIGHISGILKLNRLWGDLSGVWKLCPGKSPIEVGCY